MNNQAKFLITVRYPEWEMDVPKMKDGEATGDVETQKFPPFGVKYLFVTGLIEYPDWKQDDKRWASFNPDNIVIDRFKKWAKVRMKKDFDGDILFVEPCDIVPAYDVGIDKK